MILDKFNLAGKVAIVTGASRGLGAGMAIGLAEAGADLVVVASSARLQETVDKIKAVVRLSATGEMKNASRPVIQNNCG